MINYVADYAFKYTLKSLPREFSRSSYDGGFMRPDLPQVMQEFAIAVWPVSLAMGQAL